MISFVECDYSAVEGAGLTRPVAVQFYGPTENPFTLQLRSLSLSNAENMGLLFESMLNDTTSRATAGEE